MMNPKGLLEKAPDADLLREMIGFAAERMPVAPADASSRPSSPPPSRRTTPMRHVSNGAVGDPAQFKSAAAFAVFVGVVPSLRQSGKRTPPRGVIGSFGNAKLRRALWMPILGAVRRNDWLRLF